MEGFVGQHLATEELKKQLFGAHCESEHVVPAQISRILQLT